MQRRLFLLALALVPSFTHAAGDYPIDRATLKGLKAIGVVIDVINPEVEKSGVTRDMVLTRMLSRLSSDGIKVDPGATEFLGLRITAVRSGHGPFALSMTVGLYQPVLLSRNHEIRTSTQTWEVESVLLAEPKILTTACAESSDDLVDRFATAFHSANPK
ncbi:MAG TPA: hypothetical protein VMB03_27145 [Bryobacteraceae bacterium]|nr:hypothetical protein [Bryobacteraceae bacterium]